MSEPCIMKDKVNRLEVDVVAINDRLNRHSGKIDKISNNNLVLETILKRLEEDSKEQKQTNAEMNKTMISIQGAMSEITFNVRELNTRFAETDEKISDVNAKVNKVDAKSKVDFLDYFKTKILPYLFGGGAIGGILALSKFLEK